MIIIINKQQRTMSVYTTYVSTHAITESLESRCQILDAIGSRLQENDVIIIWKIDPIRFAVARLTK